MKSFGIWLLFATTTLISVSTSLAQEEYRTWVSKNGAYKLDAALIKSENGIVYLKKRDGKTIDVKLAALGDADNEYVKKTETKPEADPFNPAPSTSRVDNSTTKTKGRHSGGRELKLATDEVWNVQSDPYESSVEVGIDSVDLDMNHVMGNMVLSPDRSVMYAFYRETAGKPVVQRIDLTTGDMVGTAHEIPESFGLDVTPDKKVFMAVCKGRRSEQFLHIVQYGEKLHAIASFQPYGGNGKVEYARFVDNDHFLTVSDAGLLGLWNIKSLKLQWSTHVSGRPTLSPNRKLLFMHVNGSYLAVLDALTGEVKGMRPARLTGVSQLCVNDSCTTLVGVGMGTCRQWDLATGDLIADFSISGTLRDCHALFVNDHQVLVTQANQFSLRPSPLYDLVDLNLQCSMWVYGLTTPPVAALDGKVWVVPQKALSDPAPELAITTIPHSEAAETIGETSYDQVAHFDPGANLSILIDYNGPNWNRENIEENARKFVGEAGFELALDSSDPGIEVNLAAPKFINDRGKHPLEDVALVNVLFMWEGQAIWRPDRTKAFYQQDRSNRVSIFDNPWIGLVIPKAFRFYKPVLDGSRPAANGGGPPVFGPLNYYRSYENGFAYGMNSKKGEKPPRAPRPPGMRGRPSGFPRNGR